MNSLQLGMNMKAFNNVGSTCAGNEENLIGLSAGADGGQQQVNEQKTAADVDPAALEKLKELGMVPSTHNYVASHATLAHFN